MGIFGEDHSTTILVVDDDETVAAVTAEMLSRFGVNVLIAGDGVEGVKLFEEKQGAVDLVILDLIMPRMGGEETFRELRRRDRRLPILISSGLSEERLTDRFSNENGVSFIQKPFPLKTLVDKISTALGDR